MSRVNSEQRRIIIEHIKFLEMFKWLMNKDILNTKYKTPIQYNQQNDAVNCVRRVFGKSVRKMFAEAGIKAIVHERSSISIKLSKEQKEFWYTYCHKNGMPKLRSFRMRNRPSYYKSEADGSLYLEFYDYSTGGTIYPADYFDFLVADINTVSTIVNPNGITKIKKKKRKVKKKKETKVQREQRLNEEQERFNNALRQRRI